MSGFPKNTFGGTLSFLVVLVHIPYIYMYVWNRYIWSDIYTYGIFLERANVMIHILRNRDFEHLHFQPRVAT